LKEAQKNDYFVDGFLIKHFGIWPIGVEMNNLFYEQKVFLIYLMGIIPELSDWSIQVNYQQEMEDIKNLKKIKIEQSDIDIAQLQDRDIEEIKKERLKMEKKKRIVEINKKYGIENDEKAPENVKKK
jgi:hypothetical protein